MRQMQLRSSCESWYAVRRAGKTVIYQYAHCELECGQYQPFHFSFRVISWSRAAGCGVLPLCPSLLILMTIMYYLGALARFCSPYPPLAFPSVEC